MYSVDENGKVLELTETIPYRRRKPKPSYRVARAMWRLSRDKWLSPEQVSDIGERLAKCAAGGWGAAMVYKAAIPPECKFTVGMIRGVPPAYRFEAHYDVVCKAIKAARNQDCAAVELAIIRTVKKGWPLDENHWRIT